MELERLIQNEVGGWLAPNQAGFPLACLSLDGQAPAPGEAPFWGEIRAGAPGAHLRNLLKIIISNFSNEKN